MFFSDRSPRSSKAKPGLAPDLFEGTRREAHISRLAFVLDAGGDVDAVAENVVAIDDDVADVDADAENNMGAGTRTIPLRHLFLDRHGTGYGIDGAGELDQHTVACRLDDAPLMSSDCRIDHLAAVSLQCLKRSDLVRAHKSAVASNVRRQHSC